MHIEDDMKYKREADMLKLRELVNG
jgi:hypothetical protein